MTLPKVPGGDSALAKPRDEPELLIRVATTESSFPAVQARVDDAVEPPGIRFFQGLLVALAISAFLWGALAALGYGAYVFVTTI
jgi:hypothetical protein